jgi:hypothetical protein
MLLLTFVGISVFFSLFKAGPSRRAVLGIYRLHPEIAGSNPA